MLFSVVRSALLEDISGPHGETRTPDVLLRMLEKLLHLYYATTETKGMVGMR